MENNKIRSVQYRVPATGSPIPKDQVPAGAVIGWHVARHWATGDGALYPILSKWRRRLSDYIVIWRSVFLCFGSRSLVKVRVRVRVRSRFRLGASESLIADVGVPVRDPWGSGVGSRLRIHDRQNTPW